ncbi:helix-turn-helix domain-containing protein [Azospirillum himalayense]|uniref:Helix-turn-helix domain-containing protein n=1 Tax=Azospirillum himalayense TaxID=654847 RepID=A0ABW0GES8_9PROT
MPANDAITDTAAFNKEFGLRLEAARLALGLPRAEMIAMLGCGDSTYSQYTRGRIQIPPSRLLPLVKRGVSSDWLLFGMETALPVHLVAPLKASIPLAEESINNPVRGRRKDA